MLHNMLRGVARPAAAAQITLGNITYVENSGQLTINVNKPAGVNVGTLLIAFLHSDSNLSWTTLSGWTEVVDSGGRSIQYRIADGTEGSTFTFTRSGSNTTSSVTLQAINNATFDLAGTVTASLQHPAIIPGITVTENNSMLLLFGSSGTGSIVFNTPSGFTSTFQNNDASAPSVALMYKSVSSGATGDVTFTNTTNTTFRGVLVSVKPKNTGSLALTFRSSAISTIATIVAPSVISAGDIIVLYDNGANSSGFPTTIVPSGFVGILNNTIAANRRCICSYKIATGSEGGTTITGMAATSSNAKIMFVFSSNGASSVNVKDIDFASSTDTDLPAQTITSGSGTAPLVALGFSRNLLGNIGSMSPQDGNVSAATGTHYGYYKIYNSSPSDVTVDTGDGGNNNMLMSFYLEASALLPKAATYVTSITDATDLTTYSFNAVDLGSTTLGGYAVIAVHASGNNTGAISSVTVNGNAATELVKVSGSTSAAVAGFYIYPAASLSSANIVVTMGALKSRCAISIWRVTGISSMTPFHTASAFSDGTVNTASININTVSGGILIASVIRGGAQSGTATWTGATEAYDFNAETTIVSGASVIGTPNATGTTVASTFSTSAVSMAIVGVTF